MVRHSPNETKSRLSIHFYVDGIRSQVRAHAVDVLVRTDDEDLLSFLLQLVQALRYEPYSNSPLADFLVARASQNPTLGSYLHWCTPVYPAQARVGLKVQGSRFWVPLSLITCLLHSVG